EFGSPAHAGFDRLAEDRLNALAIVGVDLLEGIRIRLDLVVLEDGPVGRAVVDAPALGVDHRDQVADVLGDEAKALFALAQLFLGAAVLGHVAEAPHPADRLSLDELRPGVALEGQAVLGLERRTEERKRFPVVDLGWPEAPAFLHFPPFSFLLFSAAGFGIVSGFGGRASISRSEALQLSLHCGRFEHRAPVRSENMKLRSIELEVPDRESAVRFFRDTWGLLETGERNGIAYLRGTEDLPYVVSVA